MGKAYKCDACGRYFDRVNTSFKMDEDTGEGCALPVRIVDGLNKVHVSDPDLSHMMLCPGCTDEFLAMMVVFVKDRRDDSRT